MICSRCSHDRPIEYFSIGKGYATGYQKWCKPCKSEHSTEKNQQQRIQALTMLGGQCAHCGISDLRVLVIDHVNGDGGDERRKLSRHAILRKVIAGAPGYQVLCHNCNHLKRLNEKEFGTRARWVVAV